MAKLTSERELEIRANTYDSETAKLVTDLLGEIDFLRSNLLTFTTKQIKYDLNQQKKQDALAMQFLKLRLDKMK